MRGYFETSNSMNISSNHLIVSIDPKDSVRFDTEVHIYPNLYTMHIVDCACGKKTVQLQKQYSKKVHNI